MTYETRELKRELKRLIAAQQEPKPQVPSPRPSYTALCVGHALQSGLFFKR